MGDFAGHNMPLREVLEGMQEVKTSGPKEIFFLVTHPSLTVESSVTDLTPTWKFGLDKPLGFLQVTIILRECKDRANVATPKVHMKPQIFRPTSDSYFGEFLLTGVTPGCFVVSTKTSGSENYAVPEYTIKVRGSAEAPPSPD